MDITVAATGLVLLSPLMAAIALVVRLSSPGPALYRQERVGLCGRPFSIWKFRTMSHGSDNQLGELLAGQGRDGTPLFKLQDDPRVTRTGRVLRRTSLDELPQLVNVVRGEMSLVGPRPQRMAEVELYEEEHFDRLTVRPGVTGAWQVNGRSGIPWERAVGLDLEYVRTWSTLSDLKIMWKTVGVVVTGHGAS